MLRVGLAVVLVVTILAKASANLTAEANSADHHFASLGRVLTAAGFRLDEPLPDTDPIVHQAELAGCKLFLAEVSPYGWHKHLLEPLRDESMHQYFMFRERITPIQNVWTTATSRFLARLGRVLGTDVPHEPVWAILASSDCVMSRLPWIWPAPIPSQASF